MRIFLSIFNPRRTGGDATPIRFFWIFFLEDKTSAPDVFSRCSFIPRAHFEISWVMVSCYGYEIWRHKSHFWVKVHVFSTFLTIKVIYLCVIFPVKRKRLPFLTVLTWFIVIVKMQGKIVSKYCNISKTPGRGSIQPPTPVLVPRWGYDFACTSESWGFSFQIFTEYLFGIVSGQVAEPLRIYAIIVLLRYICAIRFFNNLTYL